MRSRGGWGHGVARASRLRCLLLGSGIGHAPRDTHTVRTRHTCVWTGHDSKTAATTGHARSRLLSLPGPAEPDGGPGLLRRLQSSWGPGDWGPGSKDSGHLVAPALWSTHGLGFLFVCLFVFYLFMRHREREAETQAEGEAGSTQGARCRTRSRDPGVTP